MITIRQLYRTRRRFAGHHDVGQKIAMGEHNGFTAQRVRSVSANNSQRKARHRTMKRYQRGDAGAVMLAMMVVMLVGWMWHGGGWHEGNRNGHMSGWQYVDRQENSALELLDQAYVRGEITRAEYLQRRADLLER